MKHFKRQLELLDYINKPLSIEVINSIYKSNGVEYEKTLLYGDFSRSLLKIVFNTYLGDELTNVSERVKHFDWCWNKVIDNFKKEGIDFKLTDVLKEYYFVFIDIGFYQNPDKDGDKTLQSNIIKYWVELFDINIVKTRVEIDVFLEPYKLFNSALSEKK